MHENANSMGSMDLQQSKNTMRAPQGAELTSTLDISAESAVENPPENTTEITTESTPETVLNPRRVDDPELARLVDLWSGLPDAVRRSLVTLAEGAARMEKTKRE